LRRFGANFWVVVGSTFLGFIGIGAIIPVLGPYVRHDLRESDLTLGLAIGVFNFVALASRLIAGPIAGRKGRRIGFIAGLMCCSLCGVAYLLPFGLAAIFIGRVLQGMGEAFLFTAAAAWALELAPEDRRAQALSFLGAGIWGGLAAGPVIGHALGDFRAAACLLALSPIPSIFALMRIPEEFTPREGEHLPIFHFPRIAVLPGLTLGFVNAHYPAMSGFLVLHLAQRGNSGGTAFSAYAAMALFARFFLGSLRGRLGPRFTYHIGLGCMMAGLLVIATTPPAWIAIAAAALIGFGYSFPWPSIASAVLGRVPERERASSLGTMTAFVDLFVGFGSFIDGAVAKQFGYAALYWLAAVGLALSFFVSRVNYTTHEEEAQ
jgi:MFS family permease